MLTQPETYVIGEIGQNHNGSVDMAKRLIDIASMPVIDASGKQYTSMNAIKLQKRDLSEELTASEMNKSYDSRNSFGKTYGEHRAFLELSDEEHKELYEYTKQRGLDTVETVCSVRALSLLDHFTPDRLKVASRDLSNLPLLEAMAATKIPIIVSTGMADQEMLDDALGIISKHHADITILHCLSQYPAEFQNINLMTVTFLQEQYPEYTIGYSDHSEGIMMPVAAVAMGAKMIEKHITLNRGLKGSDHAGSLAPDGVFRMMRDLRHLEESLGESKMEKHPSTLPSQEKLERSIAAKRDLKAGEVVTEKDVHMLSPGTGLRWAQRAQLIGQRMTVDVKQDELLLLEHCAKQAVATA